MTTNLSFGIVELIICFLLTENKISMKITIYTITDCQFSKAEKEYLQAHNLAFEEKNLEQNREWLTEMLAISNNFAGTPVTKIEKDDGQIVVLKGFTKEEFDKALNLIPQETTSSQSLNQTPPPPSPSTEQPSNQPPPKPNQTNQQNEDQLASILNNLKEKVSEENLNQPQNNQNQNAQTPPPSPNTPNIPDFNG